MSRSQSLQRLLDKARSDYSGGATVRDVQRFALAGYLIGAMKYDDSQPRDDSGRWSDTGGGGGASGDGGSSGGGNDGGGASASVSREKTIKDSEQSLSEINDHEEARIISSSGDIILKKSGGTSTVEFSDNDIKKMKGATVTHNHPAGGGSFSQEDLYLASMADVHEIRAIGVTEKAVYSMKLTDPKKGWPPPDKIKQVRDEKIAALIEIYRPQVASGKMSKEDAAIILQNRLWTRVAQDPDLNMTYTRTGL